MTRKKNRSNSYVFFYLIISLISIFGIVYVLMNYSISITSKAVHESGSLIRKWEFNDSSQGWKTNNIQNVTVKEGKLTGVVSRKTKKDEVFVKYEQEPISLPKGGKTLSIRTSVNPANSTSYSSYKLNLFYFVKDELLPIQSIQSKVNGEMRTLSFSLPAIDRMDLDSIAFEFGEGINDGDEIKIDWVRIRVKPDEALLPTTADTKPDLTYDREYGFFIQESKTVNQNILIKFKIINTGSSPASPITYIFSKKSGSTKTFDSSDTCKSTKILFPGDTCIAANNFVFPSTGQKEIEFQIDSDENQVAESNEANNSFNVRFTVVN